ncbi:MAG: FAD-binding oxidoreductase [Pseudomonadota bacterium]|nr:FAD-binding oxidoreductase [Pseudomonadota bacterium]
MTAPPAHLPSALLGPLQAILGQNGLITDCDEARPFGTDWTRQYDSAPAAVALPSSTEQVVELVRLAAAEGIALVPSGGRTGLSGGAVAAAGELVLATDRLNRIGEFNPLDRTVQVQAGVVTAELQAFAQAHGLMYPVDFASSGSSRIGGNIATNAGGIKVLRYGMTRDWVAGLKVVTGTGELLDLNRGLIKNATGYDLRHLFIGSEGTLGVIVEATMRLAPSPPPLQVMVVAVPALGAIMDVLHRFRAALRLTAFEFFSEPALGQVLAHGDLSRPFASAAPYYCLVELERGDDATEATLFELFEAAVEDGVVLDGVVSQSEAQAERLWALRERISESIAPRTPYKNDISVRVRDIPQFLDEIDAIVGKAYPEFEVVWFGHIGDGNLHLNILCPEDWDKDRFFTECGRVSEWVYAAVARYGGSVSAEHGVGLIKKPYLHHSRSTVEIELMRQLKRVLDPSGIMNPGKLIDG